MSEVTLTFEWDGKTVHKETKGFTGKACTEKTKFLDDALGTVQDRKYKAEYYVQEQSNTVRSYGS
jgi:hypothetical protein